jgi:hypothetical protein
LAGNLPRVIVPEEVRRMKKYMIDRARDLFLDDPNQTVRRAVLILQAEYPEFSYEQCLEAANLVVKVKERLEAIDKRQVN